MSKLDRVINALTQFIKALNNPPNTDRLAIYMDYEFYSMCKIELMNVPGKPMSHLDFLNDDKLFGHPVYRVVSIHGREGLIAHPDFVIHRIS